MNADAPRPPQQARLRGPGLGPRGLMRWVYTSNPFYVISAGLVFLGLRASFDARGPAVETGALMVGLASYTLLLAATAVFLVRRGKVWDDVRTVLLLVVLMFLATSVAFDETLAGSPATGGTLYLVGLGFAMLVSESVLRRLGLGLRAWYRLPYHLMLALFFLYPIGLATRVGRPDDPGLMWALFGFSPMAGLACLALLPAARRGPPYAEKDGSPWRWPLYPWVLFGLLAAAACARSYSLCVSFHFVMEDRSIFGPYFLVPVLMPCAVLLLELGRSSRGKGAGRVSTTLALLAPIGLLALAMLGHDRPDPVYHRFLSEFRGRLGGTPAFLTLLGALPLYILAIRRRVPGGLDALSLALVALAVVGPTTLDLDSLSPARPMPLALASLVQAIPAIRRRDEARGLIASAFAIGSVASAMPDSAPGALPVIVAAHLALLAAMGFGLRPGDLGGLSRDLALAMIPMLGLAWLSGGFANLFDRLGPAADACYLPALACLSGSYAAIGGGRPFSRAAVILLAGWSLLYGARWYLALRRFVPGLDQIMLGLLSFLVATLISLAKAGLLPRRRPPGCLALPGESEGPPRGPSGCP
ncbi:hypothetical protein [Tautonia plasticadhaerens]|uniref:Uncharacterized protein n=1 Tax=Tautonia plasticadhaerens TaxID=2527974 RepID=A0A518HC97_9BACT|nr:hypothetical protein [Tautonia plasticadhaerens]QDV38493.1 hypothetical protein ElP_64480 [Tautonia plasticadhaerens]